MYRATHATIRTTTVRIIDDADDPNVSLPAFTLLRECSSNGNQNHEKNDNDNNSNSNSGNDDDDDSTTGTDGSAMTVEMEMEIIRQVSIHNNSDGDNDDGVVHLQRAHIPASDVVPLQYDRYVKSGRCAVYSEIAFSELEHARIDSGSGSSSSSSSRAAETLIGYVRKGQRFAVLEDLEDGAWFHVVFDGNAPLLQKEKSCRSGYLLSYLTGKLHQIENMQMKPVGVDGSGGGKAVNGDGDGDDDLAHDADVSESSTSNAAAHVRRRQRRKKQVSDLKDGDTTSSSSRGDATESGAGMRNGVGRRHGAGGKSRKFEDLVSGMRTTYDADINTYQFQFPSIGIFHSCFPEKNGTPRQGNLSPFSKGKLVITIPNARQSIEGLEEYSHLWLVFVFHMNTATRYQYNHPKIKPPRLDEKVGVFSTRSPHRPNPIGLTAARIDRIVRDTIYLSGVDLVNGTPILDIKPYIPHYDSFGKSQINVNNNLEQEHYFGRRIIDSDAVRMPEWIQQAPEERILSDNITFDEDALLSLHRLVPKLEYFSNFEEIKLAIIHVIRTDPRPTFMKGKNRRINKLYGFRIDNINVRCRMQEDGKVAVKIIERWIE